MAGDLLHGVSAGALAPLQTVIGVNNWLIALPALAGILLLLYFDATFVSPLQHETAAGDALNYGLLFITGVLSSFHCVGMCGALVVSYAAQRAREGGSAYGGHLWYGAGKTLSYTGIGALFGLLGSAIAFTPALRAAIGMAAGVFLLLFGLGMLKLFAPLSRFQLKMPGGFTRGLGAGLRRYRHPFFVGLLNGLMLICGPLQAMYIMAAGTGSPVAGGLLLLAFGLGTLPVMLGFGALTSLVSVSVPKLLKLSGVIVIALGAVMLNRGLVLSGAGYDFASLLQRVRTVAAPAPEVDAVREIEMNVSSEQFAPSRFVLRKGVPVRWVIHSNEVASCSSDIHVAPLNMTIPVHPGTQVVEFTPEKAGVIAWSCGMGMLQGSFEVVDPAQEAAE